MKSVPHGGRRYPGHPVHRHRFSRRARRSSPFFPCPDRSRPRPCRPLPKPLQYEVNVVLKLVQVHVTDKKGNPVRDLVREDFVVTDNGQPVDLSAFEKHSLALASAAPAPEAAPDAAAEAPPAAPAVLSPGRKFFLLFDYAYNNVRGIEKAQKAALHFIDTIAGPRDQVAVLSYAAIGGLAFHEYLTTDHAQVRKVLQAIGHKDVKGRATEIEDYYWRLVQSYGGPFVLNIRAEAEANRAESEDMAQKYMLTLTDLARALRLANGEKNFILFSSGIPNSLIYGYAASDVFNRSDVGQSLRQQRAPAAERNDVPGVRRGRLRVLRFRHAGVLQGGLALHLRRKRPSPWAAGP